MAHDNGASPKRLEKYEKALQIYKDSLVEQEPRPARHDRGDASGFASGAGRAYRPQGIQPVPDVKDDAALWLRPAASWGARTGPAGSAVSVDLSRTPVQRLRLIWVNIYLAKRTLCGTMSTA